MSVLSDRFGHRLTHRTYRGSWSENARVHSSILHVEGNAEPIVEIALAGCGDSEKEFTEVDGAVVVRIECGERVPIDMSKRLEQFKSPSRSAHLQKASALPCG